MDLTASFLPKPVAGVNGNGMHTNLSIAKEGKNLFYDKKGQDGLSKFGLELHQPHPHQRQRHLPDPELQRQLVPPPRPALRGAEPDQGLGQRPRLDDPDPDRQRAYGAHRGPLDRAGRQPLPRHLLAAARPASRAPASTTRTTASGRARASCPTTSTTPSASSRAASTPRSCWARRSTRSSRSSSWPAAERCPKALGARVKRAEIQFHHEVTNQYLWVAVLGEPLRAFRPGSTRGGGSRPATPFSLLRSPPPASPAHEASIRKADIQSRPRTGQGRTAPSPQFSWLSLSSLQIFCCVSGI